MTRRHSDISSPVNFYTRSAKSLADPHLRTALTSTTNRILQNRTKAIEGLQHADALRDHARRIRAHTLGHLDKYLVRFADAVAQCGGKVYWAKTAESATDYVATLAQTKKVRSIVKSKSMVSEELELNQTLENRGIRVIETDLGEYIAQIAKEAPSHIIAPIIHKTREDVASLFKEKLGATEAEVATVSTMTNLVRRKLRLEFLNADMGISGVNFGVSETGSLCLITNEGNGRLTTTIPPIHVALMGIERVVPTIEDLEIMLQVLPRSATGQKLTAYTNIITGPRRRSSENNLGKKTVDEPDGPDELHVVLVDNGRSGILGSSLAEILYCVRCGACLNACPVYQQIGGHAYGSVYSGPMGSVLTPGLFGLELWQELPHASTLCGACKEVCPVRIDIPRMLLELRHQATTTLPVKKFFRISIALYRHLAVRPWLFRLTRNFIRYLITKFTKGGWVEQLPKPLAGWTAYRDFPPLARQSFIEQWRAKKLLD